jgi:hypothetical protein
MNASPPVPPDPFTPAEPLPARKQAELAAKLAALPRELDYWRGLSAAGQPFEKHHTQIERLSNQVQGLHEEIKSDFAKLVTTEALLERARTIELRLLAVHSVWDYFRSKFVLRAQEPFGSVLKAADAFAWACYQPVQAAHAAVGKQKREPPLVALQSQWTPTALPRGRAYEVARSPGGWTETTAFARVIGSLPVPIIGLPWHALEHLPHVALLAHEVGHVVAEDFGLKTAIDRRLADLTLNDLLRRPAWAAWSNEILADVFACYSAGPAFLWALTDVLAAPVERIDGEKKTGANGWGDYPTSTLRVRMNLEALRQFGFAAEAKLIDAEWQTTYAENQMAQYDADLGAVVRAIAGPDLLPADLAFEKVASKANEAFNLVSQGLSLEGDHSPLEPRALVAAAARLYRLKPAASQQEYWEKIRRRIVTGRPPGILAGDAPTVAASAEKQDRAAGRSLAREFFDNLTD